MATTDHDADAQRRHETLFRRLLEDGFGSGDLTAVDEAVAPECTEHQPGIEPGIEGLKGTIRFLRTAFPDLTMRIEDLVVAGDKVWGRMRARGTHLGPFLGRPATGLTMAIDIIDICRFANGKIVEHWGVPDRFTLAQQLGFLPGAPTDG